MIVSYYYKECTWGSWVAQACVPIDPCFSVNTVELMVVTSDLIQIMQMILDAVS